MNSTNTLDPPNSIYFPSFISTQNIPSLVTAWAAIVPLANHLATAVHDHQLVGQIALRGRLWIDLAPRLGVYKNIYKLLSIGQTFYDEASSKAGLSMTVFDVHWGSIFPIANGEALKNIVEYAAAKSKVPVLYEETPQSVPGKLAFRRPQVLHVQRFARKHRTKRHLPFKLLHKMRESRLFDLLDVTLRLGLTILFCLLGCYGTAAMTACTLFAIAISSFLKFRRPLSFLSNNENHDAYMLVACHVNANEWYLLTGDRGIVDCLVNKPMITFTASSWLAICFLVAEIIQLASMTFVTAVQGLDGISMTLLIILTYTVHLLYSKEALVAEWLDRDDVSVKSTKVVYYGRTQMLGAIYMNSMKEVTTWLDPILVDCPRRRVWLDQLHAHKNGLPPLKEGAMDHLSNHDAGWVTAFTQRAHLASNLLRSAIDELSKPIP